MAVKINTQSKMWYSKGAIYTGTSVERDKEYDYLDGFVTTPHGFVKVYTQGSHEETKHSAYHFIHGGKSHHLWENVRRTKRGLSLVANRFARAVVAGERL